MIVVQVALPVPLNHTFDYYLSDNMLTPPIGGRVRVPFGKRQLCGIVISYNSKSEVPENQLKAVELVLDDETLFPKNLWRLLLWSSQYYHYPIGEVLLHALPTLLRQGKATKLSPTWQWKITECGERINLNTLKRSSRLKQVLSLLQSRSIYQYQVIALKLSKSVLQTLQKKGYIARYSIEPISKKWQSQFLVSGERLRLNSEQETAITAIREKDNEFSPWLLAGITGSGKTEVYLHALENILAQGKQALVLVPEINLTPQTINRFRKRFNAPVAILHSALNDSERLSVWLGAKQDKTAIIVGTRSALFTPFFRLGIIIIDEEHDSSYKQQNGWRYHARDLAVLRARNENIPIILGTATPSLETLLNIQKKKYHQLNLTLRAGDANLATQKLIDLKGQFLKHGLSKLLIKHIQDHLKKDNQVILFLNRRGYSSALICHECGWVFECQRCNHYYTFHQNSYQLLCHYCDSQSLIPQQCIDCGSTYLIPIGMGTEQLAEGITDLFPSVPVTRIDRDTTRRKGAFSKYLNEIHAGGARILIGTQMLAKGHHFPDVTLVALLNIDGALFSNDFRSAERFAQLYIQVSGRAGRSGKPGEVFLQTHYPEHPLLLTLLDRGYDAFSRDAMEERRVTMLPPFTNHILIRSEDQNNQDSQKFLEKVRCYVVEHSKNDSRLWILGPTPAIQAKRSGYFRWYLLLQHPSRSYLKKLTEKVCFQLHSQPGRRKVKWNIDVDPIDY
ncbi:Primosomal protein N' [Candidatus Hartigia pinicola]|nr:Primosomal protein N' [Candidatus Hartigia pinicola]